MKSIERFSNSQVEPKWFLLLVAGQLLLAIVCFFEQAVSPVIFSLLLFVLGYSLVKKNKEETILLLVAFSVSVIYSLFLYHYYIFTLGAPYFNVPRSDDSSYERYALEYAQQLGLHEYYRISPTIVFESFNSKGYVYFVAVIAKFSDFIGGYHTLLPRLANALIHAFCCVFLYRLLKQFVQVERQSFNLSMAFALFPYLIYLSGHIFRDTIVCFAFVFCLYKTLKPDSKVFDWLLCVVLILCISELRFFSAIMLGACLTVNLWSRVQVKWVKQAIVVLGGVVVVGSIFILERLAGSLGMDLFETLANSQTYYTGLRSGADYSSGLAASILQMDIIPFGIALRTLYLAINPLPFLDLKIPIFINGLGTLLQVFLFVYAFLFTWTNIKTAKFIPLFFSLWVILIGVAITSFQLRHMVMYYPSLFILGGLGYQKFHSKVALQKNILFWSILIGLIGVWLYMRNKLL